MKDAQYITHDLGARNDPKLVDLQMAMGGLGLGIWWCLVEMLWEQDGYLPMNFRSLAYSLKWAKAKDVERVVTEFGLFENDGQRIWNRSALARIQHKRRVSETRASAGRASGEARRSASQTNVEQMLNTPTNSVRTVFEQLNNKLNNQEINNNISISTETEKRDIYRLFFFKNFKYPEKELQRFLDRYEGNWTRTGSTRPERDHMKLARTWKPENQEPRFSDPEALDWLKRFTAAIAGTGIDPDAFLRAIYTLKVDKGYGMTVVMQTAEWRDRVTASGKSLDEQTVVAITQPYRALKINYKQ